MAIFHPAISHKQAGLRPIDVSVPPQSTSTRREPATDGPPLASKRSFALGVVAIVALAAVSWILVLILARAIINAL
jgi:hypothetical protein